MAELIPSHVQKVFARVYHKSRTLNPTQLVVAVESHAGHGEGAEVELSTAPEAAARVSPMLRRRWCRQQQRRARQLGSKSAGSSAKWECYRCGQRGHIARNCMAPYPVASGGEQGHSSSARQQRPPHKGNNRGHRGAGRGGTSEDSGSSRSTSAQQQHQAFNSNARSSGSGSGGAAPQRTVQVDGSSTTASAPVAAPAVPSAAAPGAMPAAAPGVSPISDAWKISPWSAGWSSYPPAVPFQSSGASPPAQFAQPWRQVGITAPRAAPAVPSAAAPGAMPAAAPGVSSISPWSGGWSAYPPAVPFQSSGALRSLPTVASSGDRGASKCG